MRCTLAYEVKSPALKLSGRSDSRFPVITYFGPSKLIFTYVMEKQVKSREGSIMLNRANIQKEGTNYLINSSDDEFRRYFDLGFIFAIDSAVLEVQYFKRGLLFQQILFRKKDMADMSDFIMKMMKFDFAEIFPHSFAGFALAHNEIPGINEEHHLKRYQLIIPPEYPEKFQSLPIGLEAFLKYNSTDGIPKISIYPEYNQKLENSQNYRSLLDDELKNNSIVKNLNLSIMENRIPIIMTKYTVSKMGILADFLVPSDFTGTLNRTLRPFLECESDRSITVSLIEGYDELKPSIRRD